MSRGVARQVIFRDELDYRRRMRALRRAVETFDLRVHAFALMPNHDHIFMETPLANLSAAMQDLNSRYASYFNRRHGRVGHLFQGRFKAHLIEREHHYSEISRYIHLNPVRSGLVARPEDWPFGSYRSYVGHDARIEWVTYTDVLESFGSAARAAMRAYREFVEEGLTSPPKAPWADAVASFVVGSEHFVERVRALVSLRPPDPAIPQLRQMKKRPSLEAITEATVVALECDPATWTTGRRDDALGRALAAWIARRRFGYRMREVATWLGYAGTSGASEAVGSIDRRLPDLEADLRKIERQLAQRPTGSRR
jgi:REP element-mobilizing transposase RayT